MLRILSRITGEPHLSTLRQTYPKKTFEDATDQFAENYHPC